jgi:hypothetical protein
MKDPVENKGLNLKFIENYNSNLNALFLLILNYIIIVLI